MAFAEPAIENLWYYDFLLSPKSKNKTDSAEIQFSWEEGESSSVSKEEEESEKEQQQHQQKQDRGVEGMFRVMDEDGDGRVSAEEISRFMHKLQLPMPSEEVELMVRGISQDGQEFLTKDEFYEFHETLFGETENCDGENDAGCDNVGEAALWQAFRVFDNNGDGFISAMELAHVLCKLGYGAVAADETQCKHMIRCVDRNGDGLIDFDEFKHFMSPVACVQ